MISSGKQLFDWPADLANCTDLIFFSYSPLELHYINLLIIKFKIIRFKVLSIKL